MFRFTVVLALLGLTLGKSVNNQVADLMARHPHIHSRIVGGSPVEPNSRPWMVSLQIPGISFHFCGGSILNEDTILTAAHCVEGDGPGDLTVHAGRHLIFEESEETEQMSEITEVIVHESYGNGGFSYNDIALLKLATPLTFNDAVAAIALPSQEQPFEGTAEVMGWGTLSSGGSSPNELQAVEVPIVDDDTCRAAYGESDIADHMICSGEEGLDSCQGDSGGPMNCFESGSPDDNPLECGIVSWGRGCAMAGFPGVYTEVSYFIDWLAARM